MIVTLATFAMGTRFECILAGEDESHLRAAGEEALDEIRLWHRRLNSFARDSLVSRLNRLASSQPVALDSETFSLLARCIDLHGETSGAFDITIAPVMRTWGFREVPPPSRREGQGVGGVWGAQFIELDQRSRTIRFTRTGIEIDLGGIAKGFALDCAADILREHGITCALLHGGTSSVVAIGAPPDEAGWTIRISVPPGRATTCSEAEGREIAQRAPGSDRTTIRCAPGSGTRDHIDVGLRNQALSISAPHGRTVEHDGETRGHIIDPRTGAPARGADLAAVICDSATDAEAWSTALLVLNERPKGLRDDVTSILYDHLRGWRIEGVSAGARCEPGLPAEM